MKRNGPGSESCWEMDSNRDKIIQRANLIRLRMYRIVPWSMPLYTNKHIDQAVCVIRRRGTDKDRELLVAAGYDKLEYERRPGKQKSHHAQQRREVVAEAQA